MLPRFSSGIGRSVSPKLSAFIVVAALGFATNFSVSPAFAATPVCSSASITGSATPGGTLTAIPVCSDSPTSYTYQWSRSTTENGTYSTVSPAVNATYSPIVGDVGYYFKVSVRGVNSSGTSTSARLSTVSDQVLNIIDLDSDGKREITTCSELFTELVNATGSFEISAPGGTLNCASVSPQVPISGFGGSLNGNGASITNINLSCSTVGCGIFGLVSNVSTVVTIENFTVDAPSVISSSSRVAAVVGYASGAGVTLNQITIANGSISSTGSAGLGSYVGSILGYNSMGVVTNSSSSATVSGTNYVGGIVGSLGDQNVSCVNQRPSVANASFSGSVTGASYVGGITGAFEPNLGGSNCKISQSSSTGSVTSNGTSSCYLGGIVGQLWEARVEYSYNSSSVNPGSCIGDIGGIAGMMRGNSATAVSMEAVWNTGTIGVDATTRAVGGLVGYCEGYATAIISRSYNIGVIKGGAYSGGIAGTAGCAISNTFSRANVPAGSGGLLGRIFATSAQKSYSTSTTRGFIDSVDYGGGQSCAGSFWDKTVGSVAASSCSGATGKFTADMKLQTTFTSAAWDFLGESVNGSNDYWTIDSAVNDGYPFLIGVGVSSLSGGSSWTPPDVTAPTVLWTEPATPTSSLTFSYTLTFSEAVSGIVASDFSSTGTATGCVFTPAASTANPSVTVSVTCTGNGTFVAQLKAGMVSDAAANTGPVSLVAATSVTVAADITSPTASWTEPTSPSSLRTLSYTLTFSEAVSGIVASDFSSTGTATGCVFTPGATTANLSVTVSVTCASDGTIVARLNAGSVVDAASNTGPSSNEAATSVTITSPVAPAPSSTTTTVAASGVTTTIAASTGTVSTPSGVATTTPAVGQNQISTVTTLVSNKNSSNTTAAPTVASKGAENVVVATTSTMPVVTTTIVSKLSTIALPPTPVGGSNLLINGKVVEGVITREDNRLVITAGPLVVRIWAVAPDGGKLPLDSDGRLRVSAGDSVTVDASGFSFDTRVEVRLYSDPVLLGRTNVDGKGIMSASYEIPEGIPSGNHNVVLAGERDGDPVTMALSVALGEESQGNGLTALFIGVLLIASITALSIPAFLRRRKKEESGES